MKNKVNDTCHLESVVNLEPSLAKLRVSFLCHARFNRERLLTSCAIEFRSVNAAMCM